MMEWFLTAFNAFLATFFLIVAPPVISCVIVVECTRMTMKGEPKYRNWLKDNKLVKYAFSLHPNKGLSSQGLFWLAIMMPLTYFVFLGFLAWKGYVPRLDAEGFKTFISISALPLGVLSLALPLSVSVARFHSSKQTAKQIEIVSHKNNLDLFHSHRKELFSYFSQVGETKYSDLLTGKNHVHPRIHKNFFIGLPDVGAPVPNEIGFSAIQRDIQSLFFFLDGIIKNVNKEMSFDFYVANFCPQLYRVSLALGLIDIIEAYKEISIESSPQQEGVRFKTVGRSTEDSVVALRYIYDFFSNLCDFSGYSNHEHILGEEYYYLISGNAYKAIGPKVIEKINASLLEDFNSNRHVNKKVVID